ncbi:TadE family protein [uncultured Serinicoccus sp.]|uniref:TadE family protein n=1 Tax=uncultured Serinicoccus sp. TaxID=735514 RepID=UPI0026276E5E|nr:TadE/TadG family type IV pilus assembly protein [uncultured Serinicoccus sp.]
MSRHRGRDRAVDRSGRPDRSTERGSVTVQMVILAPVMFLFLFMAVQAGLWFHARALALGAAQDGARVAAAEDSTAGAGAAAADDFLTAGGGDGVLQGAGTVANRSATTATVTVTGQAQSLIPGWAPAIVQSASVPVERITG